ncbi:MAG: hypothetical protein JXB62_04925 [Pirellulales bacterium]|nr:hypothetical protein [Pirellulales bacterium]
MQRCTVPIAIWLMLGPLLPGCSDPSRSAADRAAGKPRPPVNRAVPKTPSSQKPASRPGRRPDRDRPQGALATTPDPADPRQSGRPAEVPPPRRRSLADLLDQPADSAARWIANLPRIQVDDARAAAAGIRKLSGKRLNLYTDMPPGEPIDSLPELFDLAFPQWCAYFHIDPAKHADWNMTGFLIQDKARFQQTGLLPSDLPPFQHGFARNHELWLYDQPSDYYRRHLLLHEGTHGFMNTMLGACGPPWYMEGMAEMLSTHRWHDGRLTLNYMPQSREEVPEWGRVRIIQDAFAERRAKQLNNVIEYSASAHLETEPYAWCWAAATLLDRHPRYQQRFRQLYKHVLQPGFSERFFRLMKDDWQQLSEQWQLFVSGMEYGYDVPRAAIDFSPGKPLPASGGRVTVAADRGWQNSGLQLAGGVAYRLRASGRYQVDDQPQIWWCEPGGVSIRYYQGKPLGILLAAVRPDPHAGGYSPLLWPKDVGLAATLTPRETGTLYLKINDSAAELDDNAGELQVEVRAE